MPVTNPILDNAAGSPGIPSEVAVEDPAANVVSAPPAAPVKPKSDALLAIQEGIDASTVRITNQMKELEAGAARTKQITEGIAASIGDITAARTITAKASNAADLSAQNATIEAFEAGGGHQQQVDMLANFKKNSEHLQQLLLKKQDITDDRRTGNPAIDNAINNFLSKQLNSEIQVARDIQQQDLYQIQGVTGAQEAFASINNKVKKSLNSASIEASYKAIEAEGRIKASQAELENMNTNATALSKLVAADNQNLDLRMKTYTIENEEAAREVRLREQAFREEQHEFQKEQWKTQGPMLKQQFEKAKADFAEAEATKPDRIPATRAQLQNTTRSVASLVAYEEQLVDDVHKGQALLGIALSPADTITHGMRKGGPIEARLTQLKFLGDSQRIGNTPAKAAAVLSLVDPDGTAPETKGTALIQVIQDRQSVKYEADPLNPVPKDPAVREADFNATAKEVMANFAANVEGSNNPYIAPPMSVIGDMLANKKVALYDKVIAPLNIAEADPQRILNAAVDGVLSKQITIEQATSGIVKIYEAAAAFNNEHEGGFARVGLGNQTSYITRLFQPITSGDVAKSIGGQFINAPVLAVSGIIGGKLTENILKRSATAVDLMNETQVKAAFVRAFAAADKTTGVQQKQAAALQKEQENTAP